MASNAQIVRLIEKRQARLERQVSKAEKSIEAWRKEIGSLDEVVFSLKGMGNRGAGRTRGTRRRRGGKWKPGHPGRPPKWFADRKKQKARSGKRASRRAAGKRPARRGRKVSDGVLAGLAKARAALAVKRKAAKSAAE